MKTNFAGVNMSIRQAFLFEIEAEIRISKKIYIPFLRILTHLAKCGCDFYVEPSRGDCCRLRE